MYRAISLLAVLCLSLHALHLRAADADLVLRGGKIVTVDDDLGVVTALAARGDRIIAAGSEQEIKELIGDKTKVIDLKGRLVIPGFIEGHGHLISLGRRKMQLDLADAKSWREVVELIGDAAKNSEAGRWIVGRGWHQGKWETKPDPHVDGYPVHDALSQVSADNPVLMTHASGHMLLANAAAMKVAGITAATGDPAGGEILRDKKRQPIGVFRENAMSLIYRARSRTEQRRTAEEARADLLTAIRLAEEDCLKHGVTSFQDAGSSFATVDLFRGLAERGKLKLRLWVMLSESNSALARRMSSYRLINHANHHLTVRAIKRMSDGALGTHGAWMLEPYDDLAGSTGHNTTPLSSIRRTADLAVKHRFQLCVHAIGDMANRKILDEFESAFRRHERNGSKLRWRIEHAQHLHPEDIPRFGKLGVIASMQAVHCTSDAPFVIRRLGARRAKEGAYVWRSLLDAGAIVINGTDAPVEEIDPLASFYSSVTRQLRNGVVFFPEQRMTRAEALRSYTRDAAFAAFEENEKGTLTPGKLADLVVLDRDILALATNEIPQARVDLTIVGGRVAYQRK